MKRFGACLAQAIGTVACRWAASGPDPYDFDRDGTAEPATLEASLARR